MRHLYGYDEDDLPAPDRPAAVAGDGISVLFVGVAAVRKGLHFALEAGCVRPRARTGHFLVAGEILPKYRRCSRSCWRTQRQGARAP